MKGFLFFYILIACFYSCNTLTVRNVVIPAPLLVKSGRGVFSLNKETVLYCNLHSDQRVKMLNYLRESPIIFKESGSVPENNYIQLISDPASIGKMLDEGYSLDISSKGITIRAKGGAGLFYGVQSLLQLVWVHGNDIPCVHIEDAPRFAYRGFHIDVSRHFFDKEFVKRQIDMMAYYKLNRLHWHLTDGAGWRIEIEKYPLLTEVAAWRPYKNWTEWNVGGRQYCSKDYPIASGGYYTRADIKEVVEYAKSRYITIIPEIEMPGHSEEVLSVYPQLACSGKPYTDSDFCIGNEETITFVEDVLTEVISLFPSEYIHIGGDEASKRGWANCVKCKALMQKEGLKDLDELQNYMVQKIEKFLNTHGRKLLGWDEILEGGLSKSATVMAWRGVQSGVKSVKQGNKTIMTPDAFCYFDSYQDAPPTQPEAMPALLPLSKVYSYNPVPDSLTKEEQALIYGVQANLWTERIPTMEHAEYMIYPRLLALSEVAWSQPERKSYTDFRIRALEAVSYLQSKGYHTFDLNKEVGMRPQSRERVSHKGVGKSVKYTNLYHSKYIAAREATLTDGWLGDWTYQDGRWQGFLNCDVDVVVDMGEVTEINSISAQFMQQSGADIWMPSRVEISISDDDKAYKTLQEIPNFISSDDRRVTFFDFGWQGKASSRYIHFKAFNSGKEGGWLFTDEIIVN